jgi:hypothetical protein
MVPGKWSDSFGDPIFLLQFRILRWEHPDEIAFSTSRQFFQDFRSQLIEFMVFTETPKNPVAWKEL